MTNILVFLLFVLSTASCQAQKSDLNLQWKKFESKESGMKISLPCEPEKYFKSFQDKPRPIHVYDFSCEVEGIKFLISSKNNMDDFNENSFKQTFEANEGNLKTMFGAIESFNEKKDFLTNGFISKYYEVKLKGSGKINMLVVVSEIRSYQVMVGITSDSDKKLKANFEVISKKFVDSFHITEK